VLTKTASMAQAGLRILLVLVVAYVAVRLLRIGMHRLDVMLIRAGEKTKSIAGATRKRVTTLTGLLFTLGFVALWTIVVVICLDQVGLDGVSATLQS
jgi:hypothetical protein